MERGVLIGLGVFRWAAWTWMALVLLLARRQLESPWLAASIVGAALVVTILASRRLREGGLSVPLVVAEVAVGAALVLADGWVYVRGHVFSSEQSLGVAWPLAGILAAGIVAGPVGGTAAGLAVGGARAISAIANTTGPPPGQEAWLGALTPAQVLSLASSTVLYTLAGAVAGYLVLLLRRAEREIAAARAREDLARRLHDGVLQTLAVVERRTDDPQLARLAREQEQDLRAFLFGAPTSLGGAGAVGRGDLGDALRFAARRFESTYDGRAEVLVPADLPEVGPARIEALAGAVTEALTNAGKHGGASRVTVYVEPSDGGLFCSIKDDGVGFDPARVTERVGLSSSIRGRVEEVGGRVEVASQPGRGAEVRLWVPTA